MQKAVWGTSNWTPVQLVDGNNPLARVWLPSSGFCSELKSADHMSKNKNDAEIQWAVYAIAAQLEQPAVQHAGMLCWDWD